MEKERWRQPSITSPDSMLPLNVTQCRHLVAHSFHCPSLPFILPPFLARSLALPPSPSPCPSPSPPRLASLPATPSPLSAMPTRLARSNVESSVKNSTEQENPGHDSKSSPPIPTLSSSPNPLSLSPARPPARQPSGDSHGSTTSLLGQPTVSHNSRDRPEQVTAPVYCHGRRASETASALLQRQLASVHSSTQSLIHSINRSVGLSTSAPALVLEAFLHIRRFPFVPSGRAPILQAVRVPVPVPVTESTATGDPQTAACPIWHPPADLGTAHWSAFSSLPQMALRCTLRDHDTLPGELLTTRRTVFRTTLKLVATPGNARTAQVFELDREANQPRAW
ncbi:hypothetical protein Mp_3g10880 [Marchantia polymorpha subsp. ruderalis]|uniref:Uncharacterized protein n=2 Tax=Marchantia polymorpha TaxID=3197 RepID=A0AAF6AZI2_MARPO|nr:hypothetical protein MARPO_0037s0108 [Marchantia polymorpha]BBN05166.1 hypothetical protein Mp_3g10880 [Marchantia polymorpha subsp. ruderalis]|eukprot:PTQ40937.1 hypothetical protein MARPO_0037s0108 [Marchantia polymorpha]